MDIPSIPFGIDGLYASLAQAHGLLRAEPDALVFELQVESLWGLFRSAPRQVLVPYAELESVVFESSWFGLFGNSLVLRARTLNSIAKLPGQAEGQLTLMVARKYRADADRFAGQVTFLISESRLKQLNS